MDNSAENKPLNEGSIWSLVERQVNELSREEKLMLAEKRRNLTLEIFTRNATQLEMRDWNVSMPIPYHLCKEIVRDAKTLDKNRVIARRFSSYTLNPAEEDLVDILIGFGQAIGIDEIMSCVRGQAMEGCTRSQKLYLDYIAGLDMDSEDSGNVHLHIGLIDSDEGQERKGVLIDHSTE